MSTLCSIVALSLLLAAAYSQPCNNIYLTESTFDSKIVWLSWFGNNNEVIYAANENYKFYRSTDGGKSWTDQSTIWNNLPVGIIKVPSNLAKMYIVGTPPASPIWTSSDTGATYQYKGNSSTYGWWGSPALIYTHPSEEDFAIATGYSLPCVDSNVAGDCHWDIYATTNFGTSWQLIESYILLYPFAWGSSSKDASYFFYLTTDNKVGNEDFGNLHWILRRGEMRTGQVTTIMDNVRMVFNSPASWGSAATYIFAESIKTDGTVSLIISEDDGDTWVTAKFPHPIQQAYQVLDSTEGSVFVTVQHNATADYGDMYVSNGFDEDFVFSMANHRKMRSEVGQWDQFFVADFGKVSPPLEGIYVANYYYDSQYQKLKSGISFDFGGSWKPLRKPLVDANGVPYVCNNCNLHIAGMLEFLWEHPGFYSVPNAIGIILAAGNVGTSLTKNISEVNTYISRDAGVNWIEVEKGMHIYEIGDFGSLLVFSKNQNDTDSIIYTWDEGATFTECQFTPNGLVEVENIQVDPQWSSEEFLLYGGRNGGGVIVHIDFSGLHERTCQGYETPGTPQSDYEYWQPTGYNNNTCFLGKKVTYIRRKQTAQCFNTENYSPLVSTDPCPCTREDYECDFCYQLGDDGVTCTLACEVDPSQAIPDPCDDYYYVSQGYRLVPGDACNINKDNAVNLLPIAKKCPTSSSSKGKGGVIAAVVIILLLIGGVIGGLFFVKKTQKPKVVYDWMESLTKRFTSRTHGSKYSRVSTDESEPFTLDYS